MDWDQDGIVDILSGCYWTDDQEGAHLQILTGRGGSDFAEAKSLLNVAGEPLQNAPVPEGESYTLDAICTHQHAVDYDGDGDLDLVVGCFGTKFFLFENIAEQKEGKNVIAEQPIALPIESPAHHSAPHLADWDGDGDLDLLSGTSEGGAVLSENTGTREKPRWADFKQLVEPSDRREQILTDGQPIEMGPATRVWATDWNGDGLLDLLIGDNTSLVTAAEGVDLEEAQRQREADAKKMEEITKELQPLIQQYQEAAEQEEELSEKISKLQEQMWEIYSNRSDYQESQSTGHVWLLIRKPDQPTQ